ncbi:hypothetical protein B7H23_06390 [Notoacmeibacter marinus]|uniref:Uncharacterized protein n=1 Tax=Notoacmeibacter marinus TaxID=1876515 RepID=A0A231V2Z8_9HYPH|nr:hypothetical protein [Notoacmeibacter marinus]OXT02520.1 hypothetical protein B7H23_06390 [Notoacmeibacter marinus]
MKGRIELPPPPAFEVTAKTFVLVNLFGVPALAFVYSLLAKGGALAAMPPFVFVVLALAIGVGVIGYNAWLTWRAKRADGWTPGVWAMALWTFACAMTLLFFGSFSPISMALAYGGLF